MLTIPDRARAAELRLSNMNNAIRLLSNALLSLVFVSNAISQTVPKNEQEVKHQRERLQAISMIEQSASEAPLWDDKKSAVRVLADAADLLWDEKPGQGLRWLTKAWELIAQVSDAPQDQRLKDFFTRSDRTELRTAVITVAHAHDRKLAEKFLKDVAQQEPNEKKDRGAFDNRSGRSEQLLQMAQQTIDADPDLAFSLAAESLVDGISYGLQNILVTLRAKHPDLANRLFDLALARFNSGQPEAAEGQVLAGYLFRPGMTLGVDSRGRTIVAMNPLQQNVPPVAASEPQRAKAFLVAVFEKLISPPQNVDTPEGRVRAQPIVVLGGQLAAPYRTYAPDLAQTATGLIAQLTHQLYPELDEAGASPKQTTNSDSTRKMTREELFEKRIADLEDKADRENNPALKKVAYVEAALATDPRDYARGKGIAGKIDDVELRADVISFVLYRAALSFVWKGELDKTGELAPQISDAPRRAVVRLAVAQKLLAAKSEPDERALLEQKVLDLLNEVERDLTKPEPSVKIARILLGRAAVLAKLDKEQAMTAIENAAQVINKLDGFDLRDTAAPDFGISLVPTSGGLVDKPRLGFGFRNVIEPLVLTNFEQLAASVDRLAAKEIRGLARLEVAKAYLRQQPKASAAPAIKN